MEDLRLAEMAGEVDMLLVGDDLVGEDQDEMLGPGVDHRLPRGGIHRPAHVDAPDLGAERRMAGDDGDGHGRQW